MRTRLLSLSRALLALSFILSCALSAVAADKAPARIVAVADVHGDHDALVQLLQRAGLLDAQSRWSGGNAVLVQTGDLVDRGPKVRPVLDFIMGLDEQARSHGGRVISLLGNHEAMNVTGDLRYVTPEIFATFAGPDSDKRREKGWKQYADWSKRRAKRMKQPEPDLGDAVRQQWMEAHPAGYFEYLDAFSSSGAYGKWIRKRDTLAKLGGVIFLHGGIDPRLADLGIDGINRRVREEMARFDASRAALAAEGITLPFFTLQETADAAKEELDARVASGAAADRLKSLQAFLDYGSFLAINPDGPLWFRGFARWDDAAGSAHIDALLKALEATHFVVGHSPLADGRIRSRFGGRVFLIDTGMLTSYYKGGRPSALEISEGKFNPIYGDAPTSKQAETPRDAATEPQPVRLLNAALTQTTAAPVSPAPPATAAPRRTWKGPDGQPLPFQSDEELLEFLKTAKVVEIKGIPEGITAPQKVLLEKDGVQAHAVFRAIDMEKLNYNTGTSVDMLFRDHYIFEPAAYHLSLLLGLDNVPPATTRSVGGRSGSIQIWLEGAMNETARRKRGLQAPNKQYWGKQLQTMHLFDTLIYNMDRNSGNILVGPDWKVWFIDHTRAFRRYEDLKDAKKLVQNCERGLLERLRKLDPDEVKTKLSPYLRPNEIKAIMKRRDQLVRYLDGLIAKKGENRVLFNWDPAEMQVAARP
jgi:hypothetical protein